MRSRSGKLATASPNRTRTSASRHRMSGSSSNPSRTCTTSSSIESPGPAAYRVSISRPVRLPSKSGECSAPRQFLPLLEDAETEPPIFGLPVESHALCFLIAAGSSRAIAGCPEWHRGYDIAHKCGKELSWRGRTYQRLPSGLRALRCRGRLTTYAPGVAYGCVGQLRVPRVYA
jgi:hypothetical protein